MFFLVFSVHWPLLLSDASGRASRNLQAHRHRNRDPAGAEFGLDLALGLGYYERAGVNVELVRVQQTPSAVAALRSGQGDMANIGTDTALQLIGRDQMKLHGVISPDKALPFVIAAQEERSPRRKRSRRQDVRRRPRRQRRLRAEPRGAGQARRRRRQLQYLAVGQPPVRAQSLVRRADRRDRDLDRRLAHDARQERVGDAGRPGGLLQGRAVRHQAQRRHRATPRRRRRRSPASCAAIITRLARFRQAIPKIWVDAMVGASRREARPSSKRWRKAYRQELERQRRAQPRRASKFTTDDAIQGPNSRICARVEPKEWIDLSFIDAALKNVGPIRRGTRPARLSRRRRRASSIRERLARPSAAPKATAGVQALHDVSLDIEPNTFVSLVGPSGCGKTTLLRMLNGLIAPDEGEILVGGAPPVPGPHMGFVFQSFRLMPWRTIRDNVVVHRRTGRHGCERACRARRPISRHGRPAALRRFLSRPSSRAG